jgi:AmmeMemoRadiSam system protein A
MTDSLPAEERELLLDIAQGAILARLRHEEWPHFHPPALPPRVRERSGAFVTLTRRDSGALRGCVGYVNAVFPLWDAVARAAQAAAFDDDRFARVTLKEFWELALEVSVLGEPRPLKAEDVEVGTHGLVIRRGGRSGLLLPQVPVDHAWDRATFLDATCRKAGLPTDAWRDPATEVLGFTAEVFGRASPP